MSVNTQNILSQQRAWYGINHLTLIDERALKVQRFSKRKTLSYMIDIISLDSNSKRVTTIAWGWLVSSVFFVSATMSISYFPALQTNLETNYLTGIIILMALCSIASLVLCWMLSLRKQVFYSRHGRIPLLEIWFNLPTRKSFRQYIKFLTGSIEQVQQKAGLSDEQQLTGEMKMLRRLADESVIDKTTYETAKAILLKMF